MPTIVDCPSCSRKLRVTEELLGQRLKCPTCGGTFDHSPLAQVAAPPPDSAPPPDGVPPPLPASPPIETVPIRLSVDDLDKPGRPLGSEPSMPRSDDHDRSLGLPREFIRCPSCHERVSAEARRCRNCGEDLEEADEFDIRRRPQVRRDCEPHRGTLILVLGIVSIVLRGMLIGGFLGLPAWIMGKRDLGKMDRGEMDPAGRGNTQAGYICGIIGTIIGGLELVLCVGYIAVMIVMLSVGSTTGSGSRTVPVQRSQPVQPNNQPPGGMK